MILGINTAQREHELCLVDGAQLLAEHRFVGSREDVTQLVPFLKELLKSAGREKSEITEIVVVKGPGPYTAVRMGVSFANALAEALGAQLYGLSTFELLALKVPTDKSVLPLVFAGGLNVALEEGGSLHRGALSTVLAPYSHQDYAMVSELNETLEKELHSIVLEKEWEHFEGSQLRSMGQVLASRGLKAFEPVVHVEEFYLSAPKITLSSNPWKKP